MPPRASPLGCSVTRGSLPSRAPAPSDAASLECTSGPKRAALAAPGSAPRRITRSVGDAPPAHIPIEPVTPPGRRAWRPQRAQQPLKSACCPFVLQALTCQRLSDRAGSAHRPSRSHPHMHHPAAPPLRPRSATQHAHRGLPKRGATYLALQPALPPRAAAPACSRPPAPARRVTPRRGPPEAHAPQRAERRARARSDEKSLPFFHCFACDVFVERTFVTLRPLRAPTAAGACVGVWHA